jgi:hypothetical protein
MRDRADWPSTRSALPTPPRSKILPLLPDLSEDERYEYVLLRLSDDDWNFAWSDYQSRLDKAKLAKGEVKASGPIVTGNPIVDEWERQLYEQYGGKNG